MAQLKVQALPSGAQIGVYEIKDVISSDWSCILYRAWNEHLNAMVALKEYLPCNYVVRDEDGYTVKAKSSEDATIFDYGLEKFLELAIILTDIHQSNVVSVHNVLQFNGTAYLAMDFENGTPLSEIHESSISFTDVKLKQTLTSLLLALRVVHKKTIVHGNINPYSIIIREDGEPVMVDFASANIALSRYCQQRQLTAAPDNPAVKNYHPDTLSSPSSDLYSLGASMFFCITGSEPAPILDRSMALKNNKPDPCRVALEKFETSLNEELLKTILWLLNPDLEQRAKTAQEVLEILGYESVEGDREEVNIQPLNIVNPHTDLLLYGMAGLIVLIIGGFWYYIRTAEPITTTEVRMSESRLKHKKSVVIEEIENDFNHKQSSEEQELATVAFEPVQGEKKKTSQSIVSNPIPRSSIDSVELDDREVQISDKLQDNSITEDEKDGESQETDFKESFPVISKTLPTDQSMAMPAQSKSMEETVVVNQEKLEFQLTSEQEEKINQYLNAAEKNLEQFNLTTPPENNALYHFQAILEIDPDNVHANVGLELILEKYIWLIEKAIKEERFNNADVYLRRVETFKPDAEDIPGLRKKLNKVKQQWEYLHHGQSFT